MVRSVLSLATAAALLVVSGPLDAQETAAQKIESAMSAAPAAVAQSATIQDWDGTVLREGSDVWTCLPDMPDTSGNDPMCLDRPWMDWVDARMAGESPEVPRMGFGYMLAGSSPESNVDPLATSPTPDNEWLSESIPHVMVIVPSEAWLAGLPTTIEESEGGPWVMWRNTDYVHIMIPIPEM